jgi:hypothetical protein
MNRVFAGLFLSLALLLVMGCTSKPAKTISVSAAKSTHECQIVIPHGQACGGVISFEVYDDTAECEVHMSCFSVSEKKAKP